MALEGTRGGEDNGLEDRGEQDDAVEHATQYGYRRHDSVDVSSFLKVSEVGTLHQCLRSANLHSPSDWRTSPGIYCSSCVETRDSSLSL